MFSRWTAERPDLSFKSAGSCPSLPSSHFIHGQSARRLGAPPPADKKVREWDEIRGTGEWRRLVTGLLKWMGTRQEVVMMGKNDVAVFEAWRLAVEKYFRE